MATMVYQFGVKRRVGGGEFKDPENPNRGRRSRKYELPDELMEQVRLAHQMKNELVELELAAEQARKDLWSTEPQVAVVEQQLAEAEEAAADADRALKDARQKAGYQKQLAKEGAGSKQAVQETEASRRQAADRARECRDRVADLRQQRRDAIAAARPRLKPRLEAMRADYKEKVKHCRQDFAAQGLYWASYNMVIDDHQVRVKLVDRLRKQGRPARLRFHRYEGAGTVAVQLQRGAGDPVRSPELIASGEGKWRNVLQVRPWMPPDEFDRMSRSEKRNVGREGEVVLNVGGGKTVTLPVVVHRMMPADADIAEASVTVRKIADSWTATVNLTVKVDDPAPVEGRKPIALHLGWRQRGDGSVRVGTWHAPDPLPIPDHLREVAVPYESGRWGEIVLPAGLVDLAGRPPAVKSQRYRNMDEAKEMVAAWLDEHPQPDPSESDPDNMLTGARVRQWRSPGRLAALSRRWQETPPQGDGAQDVVDELCAWQEQDRHLWQWEDHERHQVNGRRDDAWRKISAWLSDHAGVLVVDDTDYQSLRRKRAIDDDDQAVPDVQAQRARARAHLAAPGELRMLAVLSAQRRGVTVREVSAAHLSRTCPACGHVGDAHPRYAAAAVVTCPACERSYDQDRSAAKLMLDRERSGGDTDTR